MIRLWHDSFVPSKSIRYMEEDTERLDALLHRLNYMPSQQVHQHPKKLHFQQVQVLVWTGQVKKTQSIQDHRWGSQPDP
jgi:hypothetical protein